MIKQTFSVQFPKGVLLYGLLALAPLLMFFSVQTSAIHVEGHQDGRDDPSDSVKPPICAGEASGDGEDSVGATECDCTEANINADNCEIVRYINVGINILSGIAGIAIVGGLMIAGYQYMTARDNPGQVQAAKYRIVWAIVALGIYLFFYAFLQWLVPGGIL